MDGPDIKGERTPSRAAGIAWRDGDELRLALNGRIAVPWLVRELATIESTMAPGTKSHARIRALLRRLTVPTGGDEAKAASATITANPKAAQS